MGAVASAQEGDKEVTGAAKKAAKTMSKKSVQDYVHTKGKLPKKVTKKKSVKESIMMQRPINQMQQRMPHEMEPQMPNHEHPGCEDTVGQIFVVLKPTPDTSPEDMVHPTHIFGMGQHDPMNIHGVYHDEDEANMVAEAACNEMYKHMKEVEDKKHAVTEKISKMIKELQKRVNSCMEGGLDEKAQQYIHKISELRHKHEIVETSKKPIEKPEEN